MSLCKIVSFSLPGSLHQVLITVLMVIIGSLCFFFFFFKQKTAYEMRIRDWSSDVCYSDLPYCGRAVVDDLARYGRIDLPRHQTEFCRRHLHLFDFLFRSEEHTSELQSLMRISYAVFCLKKKKTTPSP